MKIKLAQGPGDLHRYESEFFSFTRECDPKTGWLTYFETLFKEAFEWIDLAFESVNIPLLPVLA